jgi:hypothetical protein
MTEQIQRVTCDLCLQVVPEAQRRYTLTYSTPWRDSDGKYHQDMTTYENGRKDICRTCAEGIGLVTLFDKPTTPFGVPAS